ncbi:sugar transferase [Fictibacillus barbaricus]|uniref:Sugar transferase n=1 Tax=Fictibacillus barbaricus TaxID=182136 RepID=A0ABS2ZG60_9BACL|nr:sugar transferase [Fictibacillus barbaricus]
MLVAINRAETNNYYNTYTQQAETKLTAIDSKINDSTFLFVKRLIDLAAVLILSIPASIIVLITMLAIRLESKGSALYFQERCGLNGKVFNVIKLRSMYTDAECNGPQWAKKNDSRVTRVGKFIRATRIDELPQLINVLRGDMSLVGPRPERPMFVEEFSKEIPDFKDRLLVKPGLTGWAQVNGGYDISAKEKLHLDKYYIRNISIMMDLKILLSTVRVVFTGDGAR